jgi:hypothetical protein
MTDVRGLTQSVLQTTQMDRVQDAQQRQVSVDQRAAEQQFSKKVDARRNQVNLAERVESDPLQQYEGGVEAGGGETEEAPGQSGEQEEQGAGAQASAKPEPADPDLGQHIDIKA